MIPDEAVEAAAKVMYAQDSQNRDVGEFSLEVYEHYAREVLEAVAPYIREGYADVFEEGVEAGQGKRPRTNPYRRQA